MTEDAQSKKNRSVKEQPSTTARLRNLAFIKEVVKYFMDFLETDFHKRHNPKRTVKFRNDNNLLVGIDLSKYTRFRKLVFEAINQGFRKVNINRIERGVYRANIPVDLLQLTKIQSQKLTEHPFIRFIEKPLQNLSLGDENTIYLMEDELTNVFAKAVEDKVANLVRLLIMGEHPDVKGELALVFNLEEVKNDINEFFESYQVKDLYAEL